MRIRFLKNIATIAAVLVGLFFIMNDGKKEVIAKEYEHLDAGPIKAEQVFKKVRFLPKDYLERVTDTTLANGYQVTIKYQSIMTQSLIRKDLIINGGMETYYRKFIATINIQQNNAPLIHLELPFGRFNNSKILQYVWLDQLASTDKNLVINYALYDPIENQYTDHQIHVDKQGKLTYIDISNNV